MRHQAIKFITLQHDIVYSLTIKNYLNEKNVLYFRIASCNDGELILDYSTTVSSTTNSILLPSNLASTYIIEVVRGEQHFWGEIELD